MKIAIQYDFFEEQSEFNDLKKKVDMISQGADNVRRGIFARHSALMKLVLKQQEEIEELRNHLYGRKGKGTLGQDTHRNTEEADGEHIALQHCR
jgi:hypothetical protein